MGMLGDKTQGQWPFQSEATGKGYKAGEVGGTPPEGTPAWLSTDEHQEGK